jgi:hypothetical protein
MTPGDGATSANDRLLQSRERLRQALHGGAAAHGKGNRPPDEPRTSAGGGGKRTMNGAPAAAAAGFAGSEAALAFEQEQNAADAADAARDPGSAATASPAARLVLAALASWWSGHPLHLAGTLALQTADAAVRPVAQKHPVALMAGGLAVGAALAWARPWRHLSGKTVAAVVVPALLPSVVPGLVPSLLAGLGLQPRPTARAQPDLWPHLLRALMGTGASSAGQTSQRASKKA